MKKEKEERDRKIKMKKYAEHIKKNEEEKFRKQTNASLPSKNFLHFFSTSSSSSFFSINRRGLGYNLSTHTHTQVENIIKK